jgi:hypothetical protein
MFKEQLLVISCSNTFRFKGGGIAILLVKTSQG